MSVSHTKKCCIRHGCDFAHGPSTTCPVETGKDLQHGPCSVCEDSREFGEWYGMTKTPYWRTASPEERVALAQYSPREFPVWLLTVDAVVLAVDEDETAEPHVLLIKRGNYPYKGSWALPGGFIDVGEAPADAALRELREEAGLEVETAAQIGAFGTPNRDPRGPAVSIAHFCPVTTKDGVMPQVYAGDDAVEAGWFKVTEVKKMDLAFDHKDMIKVVLG